MIAELECAGFRPGPWREKQRTVSSLLSISYPLNLAPIPHAAARPGCATTAKEQLWCPCLWPQAGASPSGLAFLCCASLWWVTGIHRAQGRGGRAVCSHLCMASAWPGGEHQHGSLLRGTRELWVGTEHVCGLYFPPSNKETRVLVDVCTTI